MLTSDKEEEDVEMKSCNGGGEGEVEDKNVFIVPEISEDIASNFLRQSNDKEDNNGSTFEVKGLKETLSELHFQKKESLARADICFVTRRPELTINKCKIKEQYGYDVNNTTYLYPEETMYLIETGKLEVYCNKIVLSVQRARSLFLHSNSIPKNNNISNNIHTCSMNEYTVYKHLLKLGYRVRRRQIINKKISNPSSSSSVGGGGGGRGRVTLSSTTTGFVTETTDDDEEKDINELDDIIPIYENEDVMCLDTTNEIETETETETPTTIITPIVSSPDETKTIIIKFPNSKSTIASAAATTNFIYKNDGDDDDDDDDDQHTILGKVYNPLFGIGTNHLKRRGMKRKASLGFISGGSGDGGDESSNSSHHSFKQDTDKYFIEIIKTNIIQQVDVDDEDDDDMNENIEGNFLGVTTKTTETEGVDIDVDLGIGTTTTPTTTTTTTTTIDDDDEEMTSGGIIKPEPIPGPSSGGRGRISVDIGESSSSLNDSSYVVIEADSDSDSDIEIVDEVIYTGVSIQELHGGYDDEEFYESDGDLNPEDNKEYSQNPSSGVGTSKRIQVVHLVSSDDDDVEDNKAPADEELYDMNEIESFDNKIWSTFIPNAKIQIKFPPSDLLPCNIPTRDNQIIYEFDLKSNNNNKGKKNNKSSTSSSNLENIIETKEEKNDKNEEEEGTDDDDEILPIKEDDNKSIIEERINCNSWKEWRHLVMSEARDVHNESLLGKHHHNYGLSSSSTNVFKKLHLWETDSIHNKQNKKTDNDHNNIHIPFDMYPPSTNNIGKYKLGNEILPSYHIVIVRSSEEIHNFSDVNSIVDDNIPLLFAIVSDECDTLFVTANMCPLQTLF